MTEEVGAFLDAVKELELDEENKRRLRKLANGVFRAGVSRGLGIGAPKIQACYDHIVKNAGMSATMLSRDLYGKENSASQVRLNMLRLEEHGLIMRENEQRGGTVRKSSFYATFMN